MSKIR